jgi:hypothetical protein
VVPVRGPGLTCPAYCRARLRYAPRHAVLQPQRLVDESATADRRGTLFEICPRRRYSAQVALDTEARRRGVVVVTEAEGAEADADGARWQRLEDGVAQEQRQNALEDLRVRGQPVALGHVVQLRHVGTGAFLVVNRRQAAAVDKAAARLGLDAVGSESAWFTVAPFYKLQHAGDLLRVDDKLALVVASAVPASYIAASEAPVPALGLSEVYASTARTRWRLLLHARASETDTLSDADVVTLCVCHQPHHCARPRH